MFAAGQMFGERQPPPARRQHRILGRNLQSFAVGGENRQVAGQNRRTLRLAVISPVEEFGFGNGPFDLEDGVDGFLDRFFGSLLLNLLKIRLQLVRELHVILIEDAGSDVGLRMRIEQFLLLLVPFFGGRRERLLELRPQVFSEFE